MKKTVIHPEKIEKAVMSPTSNYFIVVDAQTMKPQYFSVNTKKLESIGEFMDAELRQTEECPVGVFDRETALYLIGQSAISSMLDIHEVIEDQDRNYAAYAAQTHTFLLMPVYGSMFPVASPQIAAQ